MKKINYYLQYLLVRGFEIFLISLPASIAYFFGEKIGLIVARFIPKRQALILDNLAQAFPEMTLTQRRNIAHQVWRNLGRTAVEFIRLPKVIASDPDRYLIYDGIESFDAELKKGKGCILITAHFTNWEVTGLAVQARFKNVMAIARPMKNPFVEHWVQSKRSSGGMQIILHREAVKATLKWLKAKKVVGILVDQNLYTGGIFSDFFGRPAATTTLPALLYIRTGAPIVITYVLREKGKFRVVYEPPIQFQLGADESQHVAIITQTINDHLERIVRMHPENWFWIHNRWKRKPIAS